MNRWEPARLPRERLTGGALAVAQHLLIHGPSSRALLGRELALSDASMSRVARALVDDGIIVQEAEAEPGVGRPRQILSAAPDAHHVVGVKLTRDVAYGVACDMVGTVLRTATADLPAPSDDGTVPVRPTIVVVAKLVRQLARRLPSLDAIGISLGGPVADHHTVIEASFLGWRDADLAGMLGAEFPVPITVSNDVAAFTRAQLWFGAGRTHSTFAVITLGAGMGFGLVREGRVNEGLLDDGHLLAHSPSGLGDRVCSLGHSGCTAAYLNRQDVERYASSRMRRRLSFDDIAAGRTRGHHLMTAVLDDASRALGHLVATFAGALQTDRIVLAGEDIAHLTGPDSPLYAVVANRLDPGPDATLRCELTITVEPIDFTGWARGAAVVAVQDILGAL